MKFLSRLMAALAFALAAAAFAVPLPASAQVYPYTTPSYVPTAVLAPVTFTATGDYDFVLQSRSGASVTFKSLSGTLVAAIQGSNDAVSIADASATWATLYYIPCGGGPVANSIVANGTYCFNPSGFTRFRAHITTLTSSSHTVIVQAAATSGSMVSYAVNPAQLSGLTGDPCQNASLLKSSAVINIGAAATTKIVDAVAAKTVYVCGFVASLAGTTPSITFKTGTHVSADCDTGAVALSGVILPTTGAMISAHGQGSIMESAVAGQLCGTTAGTGSSFQGILYYIQQ